MNRIKAGRYKDIFALEFNTDKYRAVFLPYNGAKMASLTDKKLNLELLSESDGEKYKPLTENGNYVESECSAFDDMFPTIDLYVPQSGERKGILYPDHGEVCRGCFDFEINDSSQELTMSYVSRTLSYKYKKQITAGEDGSVIIKYKIENMLSEDFPFIWAAHIMLASHKGGYFILPEEFGRDAEIMFDSKNERSKRGDIIKITDDLLTTAEFSPGGDTYKFYFISKTEAGNIKYALPSFKTSVVLRYDSEKLPFLGIWMNNGGFKGMYNAAPEIASAPYDTPEEAILRNVCSFIPAKGFFEFELEIYTEEI